MENESDKNDMEGEEGEGTDVAKKIMKQGDTEYGELDEEEVEISPQLDKNKDDKYYEEDDGNIKENISIADAEDEGLGNEMNWKRGRTRSSRFNLEKYLERGLFNLKIRLQLWP